MSMVVGEPAFEPTSGSRRLRVITGLGDAEREQHLLAGLAAAGHVVTHRCLTADELVAAAQQPGADAILVASGLHRLSAASMAALGATHKRLIVLGADRIRGLPGSLSLTALPLDADVDAVQAALDLAASGIAPTDWRQTAAPEVTGAYEAPSDEQASVLAPVVAIVSGHGSPGRTTVAINLAAALGASAGPTVLVDADLAGPSIAAHLGLDPTRNLYMLAHASPETAREWSRAIEQETQPIGPRSKNGVAVCGVPKPEMRSGVSARFFDRLLVELSARYRYVIVDTSELAALGEEGCAAVALRRAERVLLVTGADVASLWHTKTALHALASYYQRPADSLALVVNRHDHRHHHRRKELEWALQVPLAALIPFDQAGVQRALAAQTAAVLHERNRIGRAALQLAGRLHGGDIVLPPDPERAPRRFNPLSRLSAASILRRPARSSTRQSEESVSGDAVPAGS
ncbi:MAG: P-loop NTPase [Chloroflexota bacterium]|nr:P-loop NTPase [Chloroflexota bacterium]